MNTIERGDVEEITDKLNPRALTKCKTNTLYMAMKVHYTAISKKVAPVIHGA